ncbi:MAG TPA: hypothetical protein VHQ89_02950 [Gaiellaceae bacterium]|nr:hypothetical protein [Gaiellaceae bacterium]
MSVRIGSPGDDGDVSQTISVSTGATAGSDSPQNTGSQAQSTQSTSSNISISVRIDSPGSNGAVTQTTSDAASAAPSTTQYQQPATQYPASSTPTAPTPQPDPPPAAPQPDPSPAPAPAPVQPVTSTPSSWVWNLTVSGCGDTSGSDITKAIDTGIQGWIWNWNLGTICQAHAPISSLNNTESGSGISLPSISMPDPPTPPTIASPEPPALPYVAQPVIAAAAPAAIVVPVLGRIELPVELTPVGTQDPLTLPQALGLLSPAQSHHARHHIRATPKPRTGVLAATVTLEALPRLVTVQPVRDSHPASRRTTSHKAPPPWETLSLILDSSFVPAAAGASAGGAAGGASGGAAAVLSLWLLLQLPGFAYLRLPARQRRPRSRVDDKHTRPG